MVSIQMLLRCLAPHIDSTTWRRLNVIIPAILSMTGRITMLGISRWTGKGGSYRTIQRFYYSPITWLTLHWCFIRSHIIDPDAVWLLAGDETIVTKSGKNTFGLARFFSSLYGKTVPGLSFFALSLINESTRTSHPIYAKQQQKPEKKKAAQTPSQETTETQKRKPGRPKGSKNKNKAEVELSPSLLFIQEMVRSVLTLVGCVITIKYFVLDGAFGYNAAAQMAKKIGLYLISKLQKNAELYFPYKGPYAGRGPRRKYGDRIVYNQIPDEYLKETTTEEGIQTKTCQMKMWHKLFPKKLNVVVIHKTNLKTGATAHVVLFSTDLELAYDKIVDYYRLRFQFVFNFRDAKQF